MNIGHRFNTLFALLAANIMLYSEYCEPEPSTTEHSFHVFLLDTRARLDSLFPY